MPRIPPATQALLWVNFGAYLLSALAGGALFDDLALWPVGDGFEPWQLVTYSFLHEGLPHIALNMFALYMFGSDVERVWGAKRFLTYYFTCVVSAALTQLLFLWWTGDLFPTVGASGGVFGLLLAFALLFPHRRIILIIPPIPMPAWLFVTLYGVIELVQGVTGTAAGVAHFAHLGGMLGGWLLLQYSRRR